MTLSVTGTSLWGLGTAVGSRGTSLRSEINQRGEPVKVAHLTTSDMSLRLLLFAQLCAVRDAGGEAVGISAPGPFVAELERAGIRHIPLHSSTRAADPVADLRAARELYGILRRERFDVLHTHNPKPGVYGRVVGRLARVPVIVNTVHGLYATEDDPWAKRGTVYGLEAIAARCSDAELVQNPEDLALLQRLHLTRHARLLGNGVDLTRFDGARISAEARRAARAAVGARARHDRRRRRRSARGREGIPRAVRGDGRARPHALPARGRRGRGSRQDGRTPTRDTRRGPGARGRVHRAPGRHRDAVLGDGRVRPRLPPRGVPPRGDGSVGDVATDGDHRRAWLPPGRRDGRTGILVPVRDAVRARPSDLDPGGRSRPTATAWVPRAGSGHSRSSTKNASSPGCSTRYRDVAKRKGVSAITTTLPSEPTSVSDESRERVRIGASVG